MRLSHDPAGRCARLAFLVAQALAWCGAPQAAALAPAQPAGPAPAPELTPAQMADALEATARDYSALDKTLPRDSFDVKAVVAKAGRDPAKLLAWVRDNTRYAPYRGLLRGAAGVLMDRYGNSLDRALLLAALLTETGKRVRLVRGRMTAEQAGQVLAAAWEQAAPPPVPAPSGATDAADPVLTKLAAQFKLDPSQVAAGLKQRELARQKLAEELAGDVSAQAARLTTLLVPAAGAGDAAAAERARQLEAVADHAWVQYQDGGKWVDLDVLKPGAEPGQALAQPAETLALARADGAVPAALDKSLLHEVELRLVVEQYKAGKGIEKTAMTHVLRPAEVGHLPVGLYFLPVEPRSQLDIVKGEVPTQVRDALARQVQWAPVLIVGQNAFLEKGFDSGGELLDSPGEAIAQSGRTAGGKAGGAAGVLGGLPGASDARRSDPARPPRAPGSGELTAAWIEFEVRAPGHEPQVIRRDVMDVFGPAARARGELPEPKLDAAARLARAAALNRQVDLLVAGCTLPPALLMHLQLDKLVKDAPAVARALRQPAKGGADPSLQAMAQSRPLPGPLLALASGRGAAGTTVGTAGLVVVDRPNVLAYHRAIVITADGLPRARQTIDIVNNQVLARRGGDAGGGDANAFTARLKQGILETRLEAAALAPDSGGNTASVFAAAEAQGVPWVAVRRPDDAAMARLKLDPDARARIASDLQAGYVVVAPVTPVKVGEAARTAWWRVDPRDGGCVGVGADGMGSASAETASLHEIILCIGVMHAVWDVFGCWQHYRRDSPSLGRCAVCVFVILFATEGLGSLIHNGTAIVFYFATTLPANHYGGHLCAEMSGPEAAHH